MQFRLRSLFILTALVCVYCGVINAPPIIAIPLFFAAVWLAPAYWITGVIFAKEGRRAFFIGGLAAGAAPFLVLTMFVASGFPWGYGNWDFRELAGAGGGIYGENQLANLIASLFIFAPVVLAFIGGWISLVVYHSLQSPKPKPGPESPFRPNYSAPVQQHANEESPKPGT